MNRFSSVSLLNIPGSCCHFGPDLTVKYLTYISKQATYSTVTWPKERGLQYRNKYVLCFTCHKPQHYEWDFMQTELILSKQVCQIRGVSTRWFPLRAFYNVARLSALIFAISQSFSLCLHKSLMFSVCLFVHPLLEASLGWLNDICILGTGDEHMRDCDSTKILFVQLKSTTFQVITLNNFEFISVKLFMKELLLH